MYVCALQWSGCEVHFCALTHLHALLEILPQLHCNATPAAHYNRQIHIGIQVLGWHFYIFASICLFYDFVNCK